MNARSYWKQAQGDIPEDKTSSLSTRDVIKDKMTDDFILFRVCKCKERPEWCNAKFINICVKAGERSNLSLFVSVPTKTNIDVFLYHYTGIFFPYWPHKHKMKTAFIAYRYCIYTACIACIHLCVSEAVIST